MRALFLLAATVCLYCAPLRAETLLMANGSEIKGTLVATEADAYLVAQENGTIRVPKADVKAVQADFYLVLKDGSVLAGNVKDVSEKSISLQTEQGLRQIDRRLVVKLSTAPVNVAPALPVPARQEQVQISTTTPQAETAASGAAAATAAGAQASAQPATAQAAVATEAAPTPAAATTATAQAAAQPAAPTTQAVANAEAPSPATATEQSPETTTPPPSTMPPATTPTTAAEQVVPPPAAQAPSAPPPANTLAQPAPENTVIEVKQSRPGTAQPQARNPRDKKAASGTPQEKNWRMSAQVGLWKPGYKLKSADTNNETLSIDKVGIAFGGRLMRVLAKGDWQLGMDLSLLSLASKDYGTAVSTVKVSGERLSLLALAARRATTFGKDYELFVLGGAGLAKTKLNYNLTPNASVTSTGHSVSESKLQLAAGVEVQKDIDGTLAAFGLMLYNSGTGNEILNGSSSVTASLGARLIWAF